MKARTILCIICACAITMQAQNTHNGHEYVDLGLPSGTLWATCNVGANRPEQAGIYYAFGETQPKNEYTWCTYKHGSCDPTRWYEVSNLTKYTAFDNKTILDLSDDAAHMNWGGHWRIPTNNEINELLNQCTWKWSYLNGVTGYRVIGPNGYSIFLPAAGCYHTHTDHVNHAGTYGYYWSSSLYERDAEDAYSFTISIENCRVFYGARHRGLSIRPVYDKYMQIDVISRKKQSPPKSQPKKKPALTK